MTLRERFETTCRLNDGAGDALVSALHDEQSGRFQTAAIRYRWAAELMRDAAALSANHSTQIVLLMRALELEHDALRVESLLLMGES